MKVLSDLVLSSNDISSSLLSLELLNKLKSIVNTTDYVKVRHLALQTIGNFGFSFENKIKILNQNDLINILIDMAATKENPMKTYDNDTKKYAIRTLAILGKNNKNNKIRKNKKERMKK